MATATENRIRSVESIAGWFFFEDEAVFVAALKRAMHSSWFMDPEYWANLEHYAVALGRMLGEDRLFWLQSVLGNFGVAAMTQAEAWEPSVFVALAKDHHFNRAELIPLVAHPDPNVRAVGLKLMAGTVRPCIDTSVDTLRQTPSP